MKCGGDSWVLRKSQGGILADGTVMVACSYFLFHRMTHSTSHKIKSRISEPNIDSPFKKFLNNSARLGKSDFFLNFSIFFAFNYAF